MVTVKLIKGPNHLHANGADVLLTVLSRAMAAWQTSGCWFHHDLTQEPCTLLEGRTTFSDLGYFQPTCQQVLCKRLRVQWWWRCGPRLQKCTPKACCLWPRAGILRGRWHFTWRISQIERCWHCSLRWEIHKNDHTIQTWTRLPCGLPFDLLAIWRAKGIDHMHESTIGVNDLRNPMSLP